MIEQHPDGGDVQWEKMTGGMGGGLAERRTRMVEMVKATRKTIGLLGDGVSW